jgi:hypothetical protein
MGERKFDVLTKDFCHWLSLRGYRYRLTHYTHLWAISRRPLGSAAGDVLAVDSTPILFTDPKMAKHLAPACHPCPREDTTGVRWVPSAVEERGAQ